jgi:hypothetical protein
MKRLPTPTKLHGITSKTRYFQDNTFLPNSASVSNGRTLLQPSGDILLQLAFIPFSEYGNSWSLLAERNKKARETSFCIKGKLLFVSADLTVSRC